MFSGRRVTELITNLLDDHAALAVLEARTELEALLKRLRAVVVGGFFALTAWVFFLIAVVEVFEGMGFSLARVCAGLAFAHAAASVFCFLKLGRRDPRAGSPIASALVFGLIGFSVRQWAWSFFRDLSWKFLKTRFRRKEVDGSYPAR